MRASLRCGRAPIRAGHGYADPAYRPPSLPFASIVGPLAVDIEPQRDTQNPPQVMLLFPGHIIGHARPAGQIVRSGSLQLQLDGTATVTLAGVAGRTLATDADGPAMAQILAQALAAAVNAGLAIGPDGKPVSSDQQSVLLQATVRWDPAERRFAVSSGVRGVVSGLTRSSVRVLALPSSAGTDIAPDLGLSDAAPVDGRIYRHQLRPARAMIVDVRVEVWSASQTQLAALVDDLTRRFPGRGSLLTAPSLLADDVVDGATQIRLLPQGEPVGRYALLLLEAADSLRDRVSGSTFSYPSSTGTLDRTTARIRFSPTSFAIRAVVSPTPLVPSPLDPVTVAPRGLALAIGFSFAAAPAAGQTVTLASLDSAGGPALHVVISFSSVTSTATPPVTTVQALITATATFLGTATTTWSLPASRLSSPCILHAVVVAAKGTIELYLDGDARPADPTAVPVTATGALATSYDMTFTLGDPAGSPVPTDVTFVELFSEPIGPYDPRLRSSIVPASEWSVGRTLQLAQSDDGVMPGKTRASTTVEAVSGDTLTVFPPLTGTWDRGHTIVFADEYFLQQAQLRRKDDLVNHLYRASGEYRVSALLDDDALTAAVPLVETVVATVDPELPSPARADALVTVGP
jgi:hypothetical protein